MIVTRHNGYEIHYVEDYNKWKCSALQVEAASLSARIIPMFDRICSFLAITTVFIAGYGWLVATGG